MAKRIPVINYYLKLVCGCQQSIPQVKHIARAKKPVVLPREQIMEMVHFAESKNKYTGAIMIFTAFITASRKTVLHDIRLSDLDFKNNVVTLRGCKNDLDLNVPMATTDMQKIKDYIENHRPKPAKGHEDYLFINGNGEKVYYQKLERTLRYCASNCDIREKVSPHALRHSRIKDLRQQGYSWEEIMTITGHKDITSLASYLHEEDFEKVQQKLNGDHEGGKPEKINNDLEKELEILKLKLQLSEKEKENLKMQLGPNHNEIQPIPLGADHQKGYV